MKESELFVSSSQVIEVHQVPVVSPVVSRPENSQLLVPLPPTPHNERNYKPESQKYSGCDPRISPEYLSKINLPLFTRRIPRFLFFQVHWNRFWVRVIASYPTVQFSTAHTESVEGLIYLLLVLLTAGNCLLKVETQVPFNLKRRLPNKKMRTYFRRFLVAVLNKRVTYSFLFISSD